MNARRPILVCPACGRQGHQLTSCRQGRDVLWALAKLQLVRTFTAPVAQRWARAYLGWGKRG